MFRRMGDFGCRATAAEGPDSTPPVNERPGGGGVDSRWLLAAGVVAAGAVGAGVVITRRRFLGMGALVGAAMVAPVFGASRTARAAGARPNIVWFRSEDNGAEFVGAYGSASARTPNIDRLASEGVRFSRFFTTSPVCAPTKLGWATGMYEAGMGPGEHMRAQGRRPDFAVGFATWLAEAGYWCTTSGNVDYNTDLSEDHGFHDTSGNWQAGVEAGQPFLALLGSSTTHEVSMAGAIPAGTDPAAVELPSYVPDDPVLRADRAAYFDKVTAMDQEVGDLVAQLAAAGVADDTIVIYSSDHGGVLPRSKRFCYDSGLHAPLVVRFPPAWQHLAPSGPGTVIDDPVSSIDAPPTVLHLAGVEIPEHFQGQPFAGPTCAPRQFAFGNRNRMDEAIDFVRTVRDERYRYIRNYMPHLPWGQHVEFMWGQAGYRRWEQLHLEGELSEVQDRFWQDKPYEELYDLHRDPDEVVNLVDDPDHRERLDALRAALDEHMVAINDNGFIPEGSPAEGWEQSRVPGAYPLERLMELAALAARRDADSLPALVDALGDDNEIVRYWGALGCSMLGADAASAADVLSNHMDDPDETRWVRVQCADALARAGSVAPAAAFLGLVAGDETEPFPTRLQAVQSLLFLGPEAIAGRDGLVTAAAAADEYVSVAGAHALQVVDGTYAPAP
jgi:arylsulfatase A-like enzyme